MNRNDKTCKRLQDYFNKFGHLWREDAYLTFSNFISGKATPLSVTSGPNNSDSSKKQIPIMYPAERRRSTGVSPGLTHYSHTESGNSQLALHSLINTSAEKSFLTPEDHVSKEKTPTLEEFDKRISFYQALYNDLVECSGQERIGWLQIDLKPVKQVLLTHASRWVFVFVEYLTQQCNKALTNIELFLTEMEPQIENLIMTLSKLSPNDGVEPEVYMKLIELFNSVTNKQEEFDTKFGSVKKTVNILHKYKFDIEKEEFFRACPSRWSNLRAKVVLAKQRIGPKMQVRSEQISQVH